jgi:hypothetical protein
MRVTHVAPSVFGPDELYGGGERYPLELARALAAEVDCRPVSFGARPGRWRERGGLKVRVLRPLARLHRHPAQPVTPLLVPELVGAEIVHNHFRSVPTRVTVVTARARGGYGGDRPRPAWPDLGRPGAPAARPLPDRIRVLGAPPARARVIYGGADPHRFAPRPGTDRDGVLFVGR